jgi:hypothetical protein
MRLPAVVLLLAVMLPAACSSPMNDDGGTVCLTYAAAGITLTVRDSATSAPLADAATRIYVREGAFVDSALTRLGGPDGVSSVGLVYERRGTYEVTVERSGYLPWRRSNVVVTADACHVRGVQLTALLQRAP